MLVVVMTALACRAIYIQLGNVYTDIYIYIFQSSQTCLCYLNVRRCFQKLPLFSVSRGLQLLMDVTVTRQRRSNC